MNLSQEQKDRLSTIIEIGKMFGGNESIDKSLMGEVFNVLLPEEQTDKIDELASAYGLTQDPAIQGELTNALYEKLGINPQQEAQEQSLLKSFSEKYPTEQSSDKKSFENTQYQTMMAQNPELLSQYYNYEQPNRNLGEAWKSSGGFLGSPISLLSQIFGGETEKQKRERLSRMYQQYQSNIPTN